MRKRAPGYRPGGMSAQPSHSEAPSEGRGRSRRASRARALLRRLITCRAVRSKRWAIVRSSSGSSSQSSPSSASGSSSRRARSLAGGEAGERQERQPVAPLVVAQVEQQGPALSQGQLADLEPEGGEELPAFELSMGPGAGLGQVEAGLRIGTLGARVRRAVAGEGERRAVLDSQQVGRRILQLAEGPGTPVPEQQTAHELRQREPAGGARQRQVARLRPVGIARPRRPPARWRRWAAVAPGREAADQQRRRSPSQSARSGSWRRR